MKMKANYWDLVVIEPTVNTPISEGNHLRGLIAAFTMMMQPTPRIVLLSALFHLADFNMDTRPLAYDELP